MSKKMIATFTDKAYKALLNGEAVDNNGFRSNKGNFYPEQPSFSPMNERQEQAKDTLFKMGLAVGGYITFQVILPEVKRFNHEKIYPFLAAKWDDLLERNKSKKDAKQSSVQRTSQNLPHVDPVAEKSDEEKDNDTDKIINLEDYRKRA